jgi:hypothetical protein
VSDSTPLTADDLARIEHRARRFQGAWTGTSGTLAADVMRLLAERQRLLASMASSATARRHMAVDQNRSCDDRDTSDS